MMTHVLTTEDILSHARATLGLGAIASRVATILRHDEIWEAFAKQTEAEERGLIPVLVDLFNEQLADVLRKMGEKPPPWLTRTAESDEYVNEIFKPEEWAATFQVEVRPPLEDSMESAGKAAMQDVTVGVEFSMDNPRIRALMDQKVFKFAREVNETTLKNLRKTLGEAIDAGEDIRKIRDRVKGVFDIVDNGRAEMIARTEIIGTHNRGTLEAYKQSGVVSEKTWITSRDSRVRDLHQVMDGETVPLNSQFSNGLQAPGEDMKG
jgi:SPP1 gp7 family putative phage head morphogenesis protein